MKRILFIISALVLLIQVCEGQYTTVVTKDVCFPTNTKNKIVRNWTNSNYALTYSEGDGGVFRIIDYSDYLLGVVAPSFQIREAPIPNSLDGITDMRIMDDIVCFCGYRKTTIGPYYSDWFIGCFKMSELVAGIAVNYRLIHIDQAVNLWKIEGFNDSYGFRVYALGLNAVWTGTHWWERHGIFEVINPLSATGYNYVLVNAVPQQPYHEFLDDIVVRENDIVFVGRDNNFISLYFPLFPSPAISMRRLDKSLGLADPQLGDNHHFYVTPGVIENNSSIQAKPLQDDQFVIAYTYSKGDYSWRRIRVFNASLININSQEYALNDKSAMKEMAYNTANGVLTILEPWGGSMRFFFTHPMNTTNYAALTLYDPFTDYSSLDTISGWHFLSTKNGNWTMQYADQISYNPLAPNNNCLSDGMQEVEIIPPMNEAIQNDPPIPGVGGNFLTDLRTVSSCIITDFCLSY